MYALVLLGRRRCAGVICVAGAALGVLKGSDVRPGAPGSRPLCRCDLRGRRRWNNLLEIDFSSVGAGRCHVKGSATYEWFPLRVLQ